MAKRLRYVEVPIICVANKTDDAALDSQADEFYRLGRGKLVRTSTQQNRNRELLLDMIAERLPLVDAGEVEEGLPEPTMKVAIVGRRNTGKSTLVNTLAQAERMIVSEVPGTTRDSVDVRFELDGKAFMAIDTPGLQAVEEHHHRHRFLQHASSPAEHSPGGRRAAVFRSHAADQQSR